MTYTYGELHRDITKALRAFPDDSTVVKLHMNRTTAERLAEAVMLADGVQTTYDAAVERVRVAYEAMRPLVAALAAAQETPLVCNECGRSFDTMLGLNAHALWHESGKSYSTAAVVDAFARGWDRRHNASEPNPGTASFPAVIRCNSCDAAFISTGEAARHSCPGLAARGQEEAGFTAGARAYGLPIAGALHHMCDECGVWFATEAELQEHLEQTVTTTGAAEADSWARTRARNAAAAERNAERLRTPEEEPRSPKPHPGPYKAGA